MKQICFSYSKTINFNKMKLISGLRVKSWHRQYIIISSWYGWTAYMQSLTINEMIVSACLVNNNNNHTMRRRRGIKNSIKSTYVAMRIEVHIDHILLLCNFNKSRQPTTDLTSHLCMLPNKDVWVQSTVASRCRRRRRQYI